MSGHAGRSRANARRGAAASRAIAQRPPVDIDWDAAIERLKAMLDDLDRKGRK
jgi:hypothetical protein